MAEQTEVKTEKKLSKAFVAYKEVADLVRAQATHDAADGKAAITVSSLKPSVRDKGDQIFYINAKATNESLQFTLTRNGVMKGATYFVKDADTKPVFLAKDIAKMQATVKDTQLKKFAATMDWSKAPVKEATAPEVEIEK